MMTEYISNLAVKIHGTKLRHTLGSKHLKQEIRGMLPSADGSLLGEKPLKLATEWAKISGD